MKRLRAFLVVLGAAALVIVGLVLQAIINVVEAIVPGQLEATTSALFGFGTLGSVLTLAVALTLLYHELGPDKLSWRPAVIAAMTAAVAMTVGNVTLAAYLTRTGQTSIGGARAGVLLALLWIYYQAQILLAGAHPVRVLTDPATPNRA